MAGVQASNGEFCNGDSGEWSGWAGVSSHEEVELTAEVELGSKVTRRFASRQGVAEGNWSFKKGDGCSGLSKKCSRK